MVATPYTMDDLKSVLAEVSGDRAFADMYFSRFIQGHDVVDYTELLARAGLVLRKHGGNVGLVGGSVTISTPVDASPRAAGRFAGLQSRSRSRRPDRVD